MRTETHQAVTRIASRTPLVIQPCSGLPVCAQCGSVFLLAGIRMIGNDVIRAHVKGSI